MGKTVVAIDWEVSRLPYSFPWQRKAFPVVLGVLREGGEFSSYVFNHKELARPKPHHELIKQIQDEIDGADVIVGHNLKFDHNWLLRVGVHTTRNRLYCTQVAEYLIRGHERRSYSLDSLSKEYGLPPKQGDKVQVFWEAGYDTDEIPLDILMDYLKRDCTNALLLYNKQRPKIRSLGLQSVIALEMEKLRVLSEIECSGMRVNLDRARNFASEFEAEVARLDERLRQLAGFDLKLDSVDDLSAALYGGFIKREGVEEYEVTLKSGVIKKKQRKAVMQHRVPGLGFSPPGGSECKKSGVYSTSKDTLAQLKAKTKEQREFLQLLMERSHARKTLETFIGKDQSAGLIAKVQHDGCVHPMFNMTVTRTGRLSSSDPNGQNIPRKGTSPVKKIFVPKFDLIGNADLSQLEWRVAAYLSQDPVAIKEIVSGVDYHLDNAIRFFGDERFRTDAKVFGFRLLYGGSAYGMYKDASMPRFSLKRWERIVNEYYEKYEGIKRWQQRNIMEVIKNGGKMRLPSGRILTFRKEANGSYSERKIKNYPVQSFATADIMPLAMVVIYKRMKRDGYRSHMICQVHDSIVFDVVRDEVGPLAKLCVSTFRELPALMQRFWGIDFNVPLTGDFEVGEDYGSLQPYAP